MHSWSGEWGVLSCHKTWNTKDQTPYYAQAMPKCPSLVTNYLQSHYFCNVQSPQAMLLSVRNLAISCLTTFHCVCSHFCQSWNLKKCIHSYSQLRLNLWQFEIDLWNTFSPYWWPTLLWCWLLGMDSFHWNEPFKQLKFLQSKVEALLDYCALSKI